MTGTLTSPIFTPRVYAAVTCEAIPVMGHTWMIGLNTILFMVDGRAEDVGDRVVQVDHRDRGRGQCVDCALDDAAVQGRR